MKAWLKIWILIAFFEDAEETHEKKEKFEIVIKYKDEKQYKKRLKKLEESGWL